MIDYRVIPLYSCINPVYTVIQVYNLKIEKERRYKKMKTTNAILNAKIETVKNLTGLNVAIQTAYGGKKIVLVSNKTGAQIELGYQRMTSGECSNVLEILTNVLIRLEQMPEAYTIEKE